MKWLLSSRFTHQNIKMKLFNFFIISIGLLLCQGSPQNNVLYNNHNCSNIENLNNTNNSNCNISNRHNLTSFNDRTVFVELFYESFEKNSVFFLTYNLFSAFLELKDSGQFILVFIYVKKIILFYNIFTYCMISEV